MVRTRETNDRGKIIKSRHGVDISERRKRERPRKSWGDNITKAMRERNLTEEQCQNRDEWGTYF